MSAKNLFQTAVNALSGSSNLNKVVIMKQTPRYDPLSEDPLSLKPALSLLYNNIITEEWMTCEYKDKIYIGSHNIDCTGAIREARYRETKSGKFDGLHLWGASGRKIYTLSVLNILRSANVTSSDYEYHQSCAQYKYQNKQSRQGQQTRQQTQFNVPTANRFERLSAVNQGN